MNTVTDKEILTSLSKVQEPESGKDLVALNMVKDVKIEDSAVSITLEFKSPSYPFQEKLVDQAKTALLLLSGVDRVTVKTRASNPLKVLSSQPAQPRPAQRPGPQTPMQPQRANLIPSAQYTIAVASGKGGVGKTTVAVNLAISLARTGATVGLLDADIYGPNIPIMMGAEGKLGTRNNKIAPMERYGVHMVSVGFIAEGDTAIIWRGPLVGRMIQQFLQDVDWGQLDYLVIDLPPGTGDAQLTLTQAVPLTGAVVVTTPQDVALADAKKGVNMFRKVEVPVLGIVENMSYFVCPHCQERTEIFDHGGGKRASEKFNVPFLGEIPLETNVRIGGDKGTPIVVAEPDSPVSKAFEKLAADIMAQVSTKKTRDQGLLKRVFKIS
ncbi:MAG: Mrp/NBP35 family ATP-binding protein [bacterium]